MTDSPLFSVIVTTFGRETFLSEALGSVFAQTIEDFEVVLVVDGGEVPSAIPDDPRLRVVRREVNGGVAAALNTGLGVVRGRYVTVLDDDDLYTEDRLELGLRGMERAPIAICWRANPDTGKAGRNRVLEGLVHDVILERPIPTMGQTTVVREAMLPFDERLRSSSDVDWWIRATSKHPVTTEPHVGLWLRRHEGRISLDLESRYRSRSLIYEKHQDYFESRPKVAARYLQRNSSFALAAGYADLARRDLWRAFKMRPTPGTALRLMRASLPASPRASDTGRGSR